MLEFADFKIFLTFRPLHSFLSFIWRDSNLDSAIELVVVEPHATASKEFESMCRFLYAQNANASFQYLLTNKE